MRNILIAILLNCCILCSANSYIYRTPDRRIRIDNLVFAIKHLTVVPKWTSTLQNSKTVVYPEEPPIIVAGKGLQRSGVFNLKTGENLKILEVTDFQKKTATIEYELSSKKGVPTVGLSLMSFLKSNDWQGKKLLINGEKVLLSKELMKTMQFRREKNAQIEIPLKDGRLVISGDFGIKLEDSRKRFPYWNLSLKFNRKAGRMKKGTIKLKMKILPVKMSCIDLNGIVNMAFEDKISNDKKGGWTDQGEQNDLRGIPVGKQNFKGLEFSIIDPTKNNNRSALVLRGKVKKYFPQKAEVLFSPIAANYLYVLTGTAWTPGLIGTPIGKVEILYADGTFGEKIFKAHIDVADWLNPIKISGATLVWRGENNTGDTGLYVTTVALKSKKIKGLRFSSTNNALWMIVAASLSNSLIKPLSDGSFITKPGKEWIKAQNLKQVEKNSILDFSKLLDGPAGKHGFLKFKNNKLLFADGTRARFWGGNLIFSACTLLKKDADIVAEQLAMLGYNMVRLHGHDYELNHGPGKTSTYVGTNPEKLDRFDYQMAAFKKRGIYICQDLYSFRKFKKGDFPEYPDYILKSSEYKALMFLKKDIRNNFKQFAANLLNHVNPYTGLAMKNDPAYPMISLINEDTLNLISQKTPLLRKEFTKAFNEYASKKKWQINSKNRDSFYKQFLVNIYRKTYREMHDFLRGLGVKAMLSDLNLQQDFVTMLSRKEHDFVDNHFYWGNMVSIGKGRNYMERLPVAISSASSIPQFTGGLKRLFPSRIFGKPFIVSEYDYLNPGKYNIESGFVPTAYASLQNWDGLIRFAYGNHWKTMMKKENHLLYFEHANDPMTLLAQRVGALFFLRRDVAPSREKFIFSLSEKHYLNNKYINTYPHWMSMLGLIGQAGTIFHDIKPKPGNNVFHVGSALPANANKALKTLSGRKIIPNNLVDLNAGIIRSSTGEIELNSKKNSFRVVTPKSEGFLMEAYQKMQGKFVTVVSKKGFAGILVASFDNQPLQNSKRLLVLHLTDAKGANQKFGDSSMTLIESWGDEGSVFRNGTAEITLNTTNQYSIYACALNGKRLFKVPIRQSKKDLSFVATVASYCGPVCVYELVLNEKID